MKNNMIIFHFPLSLLFLYCSIVRFNCQLSHCFSKLTMIYGIMVNDLLHRPPPTPPHHHHTLLPCPICFKNYAIRSAHFIIFSFSVLISTKLNILKNTPRTYKSKYRYDDIMLSKFIR